MITPEEEKLIFDALNKAVKMVSEITFKQCISQKANDFQRAGDIIEKCESVTSKYYIHKFKGVKHNEIN